MSEDYGISNDGGFHLVHMVQAQRGLSPREIEIFLATGKKPDLNQPPPEELERIDGDTQVMPLEDAAAWLSGGALTASSFFDFDPSHSVSPLYEVVRPKVEALRFDPHQPRADDGRWSDGGSLLTKPRNVDEFAKRLRKASTGRRALSAAKSNADWRKKDPLKDQCAEFYQRTGDSVNGPLRRGETLPPKPRVVVRELDMMMAESPLKRDVQIMRGIGDPTHIFGDAWNNYGDNAGLEWEDDAFVSGTTDDETAKYFATARPGYTPTVMRMLVPKGTPALHLESARFAQWELLLGRGYRYRIVEDSGHNTRPRELSVEVIAPNAQAITAATEAADDEDDVSEDTTGANDDVSRFIDNGDPVRIIATPDRDDDDVTSAAFRFDKNQPRDDDGRWSDVADFGRRLKDAAEGRKALKLLNSTSALGTPHQREVARKWQTDWAYSDRIRKFARTPHRVASADNAQAKMDLWNLRELTHESRASKDIRVSRGMVRPERVFGDAWNRNGDNTGLEWVDKAPLSTSANSKIAKKVTDEHEKAFGDSGEKIVMHILVPEGTGAVHLDDANVKVEEVLLMPGLRYRILHDSGPGKYRTLEVTVVPQDKSLIAATAPVESEVDDDNDNVVVDVADADIRRLIETGPKVDVLPGTNDDDNIAAATLAFDFDPHQPRDGDGKWSDGGANWRDALNMERSTWEKLSPSDQVRLRDAVDEAAKENLPWSSGAKHKIDVYIERDASGVPRKQIPEHLRPGASTPAPKSAALESKDALESVPIKLSQPVGRDPKITESLDRYASIEYTAINAELRASMTSNPHVKMIDEAMRTSRLPSDIVVYRGMSGRGTFGKAWLRPDMAGVTYRDPAYVSTTTDKNIANSFTGEEDDDDFFNDGDDEDFSAVDNHVVARIVVPAGTGAVQISGEQAESEILLDRNMRFRIVQDHGTVAGVRQLDVEVIR